MKPLPKADIGPLPMQCERCGKKFPLRRRNPKTSLCRSCWSIEALKFRKIARDNNHGWNTGNQCGAN